MKRKIRTAGGLLAAAALVLAAVPALATGTTHHPARSEAHSGTGLPRPGITRAGPWLVDSSGRVLVLHGFDIVRKTKPWYPARFGAKDARFLRSQGFNAARIGMAWSAIEPAPGRYDNAYLARFVRFEHLLGRYGIHTLVDVHQDLWSSQNMPRWATLGSTYAQDFQDFWANRPASDGVGIQTLFIRAWRHVARLFRGDSNVFAFDPFNEPQPGTASLCPPYVQCPQFERGQLSAFYRRYVAAVRTVDKRRMVLVEPVADNNLTAPALRLPRDRYVGTTFHEYCNVTQTATQSGPQDALCRPIDQRGLDVQSSYARQKLGVPTFVGEWSSNDADDDNAYMVDLMQSRFLSWTMWMYYTASTDPANTPGQGLLINDDKPGSVANAKAGKLDAVVVPYATAIAGTPKSTSFDRSTGRFQLTYATRAVAGATLRSHTTVIFLPRRIYRSGAQVTVTHARVRRHGQRLAVTSRPGAKTVTVTVTRRR
jgi:endoglycosylceramidase